MVSKRLHLTIAKSLNFKTVFSVTSQAALVLHGVYSLTDNTRDVTTNEGLSPV